MLSPNELTAFSLIGCYKPTCLCISHLAAGLFACYAGAGWRGKCKLICVIPNAIEPCASLQTMSDKRQCQECKAMQHPLGNK